MNRNITKGCARAWLGVLFPGPLRQLVCLILLDNSSPDLHSALGMVSIHMLLLGEMGSQMWGAFLQTPLQAMVGQENLQRERKRHFFHFSCAGL